jgi:hypothetical protein
MLILIKQFRQNINGIYFYHTKQEKTKKSKKPLFTIQDTKINKGPLTDKGAPGS